MPPFTPTPTKNKKESLSFLPTFVLTSCLSHVERWSLESNRHSDLDKIHPWGGKWAQSEAGVWEYEQHWLGNVYDDWCRGEEY